jgi:ADP-ribose pyrophosphatase
VNLFIYREYEGDGQVMNDKFKERTLSTKSIYQGKIISLQVDEVELPDGKTASREIVKHSGAVAVLALLDDRMIVVEQFRKPLERSLVEIPAGKLEPDEDVMEAAARELQEETGYTAESVRLICSFYTSPGFANEIIHLYAAEGLQKGEMNLDDDEFIECENITLEQAQQYITDGKIRDAKTITAVYAWQNYKLTGKL